MAKTFDEILSEGLSERLGELDSLMSDWITEITARDRIQSLFIVRAYAHLEGGVKTGVNIYLKAHTTKVVSELTTGYWYWREKSVIDRCLSSLSTWSNVGAARVVLTALAKKNVRLIDTTHEYNQMYSDKICEIYKGLGICPDRVNKHSVILDDLVRKRHIVAHGTGEIPLMDHVSLRKYHDAVDETLSDLYLQLCQAYPDGTRRRQSPRIVKVS